MIDLETQLRQHFAHQDPGTEFDARVLQKVAALRLMRGSQQERAAAAAERYARERAELLGQRRETLLWLLASAVMAVAIALVLAPVTTAALPGIAAVLGSQLGPGLSFGVLLTLLPLAVWLGVRQPRMASRW